MGKLLALILLFAQIINTGGYRKVFASGGGPSATYVGGGGSNSTAVTYSCTSGNFLHAAFWNSTVGTTATIASSPTATWNAITNTSTIAVGTIYDWWALCPSTGSITITVTAATVGSFPSTAVTEYTFTGTPAIDQVTNSPFGFTSPVVMSVSGLAGGGELGLAAAAANNGGAGSTTSTGWVVRSTGGTYINMLDNLSSGPSTDSVSITLAGSSTTSGVMGVMK